MLVSIANSGNITNIVMGDPMYNVYYNNLE